MIADAIGPPTRPIRNSEGMTDEIDKAFDLLLERESYAYTALWESFALNQRRFLLGLAIEGQSPAFDRLSWTKQPPTAPGPALRYL